MPAQQVSRAVLATMALAQFALFVALIAPVTVSLALKTQTLVPRSEAPLVNAHILAVAGLVALVANPLCGRLSDLTTSRWGRRRPWLVGGALVFLAGLASVALAPTVPVLLGAWCVCQFAGNAILAALMATVADVVPSGQRGVASANVGVMQQVGVLVGAYGASRFVEDLVLLFIVPALLALAAVLLFAVTLPDRPPTERTRPAGWVEFVRAFWVSPRLHPDFALVWVARFLMLLAAFLFVTFRLFYLQSELGLTKAAATEVLANGVLIYTAAGVVAAQLGGRLSDRLGRRKIFVIACSLVSALGLTLLAHTDSAPMFYAVEAIMGIGSGVYWAVDTALVVDVLPNPDHAAKDLGVLNIANVLPQSLASLVGAALLSVGTVEADNYQVLFRGAGVICVLGALAIIPVRGVR